MGNFESQCQPEISQDISARQDPSKRIIDTVDFLSWSDECHSTYGFTGPCNDYHTNPLVPYSFNHCYSLEVKFSRRRSVQFRRDLNCYTAELERLGNGRHSIHIRDHLKARVIVVPLARIASRLPELDYMYDPILTVIAYHRDIVAISVMEKTKNIPKIVIVCDISHGQGREVGYYTAQLNYSNLNSVHVDCCISPDCDMFVIYVLEDHYDEFHAHFHAIQFDECKPVVICTEKFGNPTWYEPGLKMCFLADTDKLVVMGECPIGSSQSGPARYLAVYDLDTQCVEHGLELPDSLYPVSLNSSPDGAWIATMSRNHATATTGAMETYVIKLYSSYDLTLHMQLELPLTPDTFNALSNCNKMVFSENSKLLALAFNEEVETNYFGWEFGPCLPVPGQQGMASIQLGVYRLPVLNLNLKALCRDAILDHCSYFDVSLLPLPSSLIDYVKFKGKL